MIQAFTSGAPDPISAQVDVSVDLSSVTLPQTVNIYGGATDSSDPSATFSYQWVILHDAVAPGVSLSSSTAQNPTLTINSWGNSRLILIATNTVTLEASSSVVTTAPDTAFLTARVLSEVAGLQKPAPGERNYSTSIHAYADAIENGTGSGGLVPHDIADHTDVSSATGPDLDQLTDGSYAAGLHLHAGEDIDAASSLTLGVVRLEHAGSGNVIQRESRIFTGSCQGTQLESGFWAGIIVPPDYDGGADPGSLDACVLFYTEVELKITSISLTLASGGTHDATHPYLFNLVAGNINNVRNNTLGDLVSGILLNPVADNTPAVYTSTGRSDTIPAGQYFGIRCAQAPLQSEGEHPGSGLSVTIHAYRQV